MTKKHIEFIVNDHWANGILDELSILEKNDGDMDRINELRTEIGERYYIDEDLDAYESLTLAWINYVNKESFFEAIRREQMRRRERKRQPNIIKEKAMELGLW